ncbi:MAG: hypothetical protein GVY36_06620 [Verrucomicrobia bacterium]|jgi:transposase-like protein|nr:hypothetical protein [Verrucomicrobiota bacterium]
MENEQFELVDRGEKRDTRGRVIQKREERERILAAYDESGLTQRAFAKREGVKYSTLVWWLKQRRERNRSAEPVRFEEVRLGSALEKPTALEVVLADGTRVRGGDPAMVGQLVRMLRG